MVVTVVVKGKTSGVPVFTMVASAAATEPELPAERTVTSAFRCQVPAAEDLVWVQIVVEPSFRVRVTLGALPPGSSMEPNASNVRTLRDWRTPLGNVAEESSNVPGLAVERTVTCAT